MHCVYMLQSDIGKLYIGVSKNVKQRFKEHNTQRGSAFTKAGKFELVFWEEYESLADARQREIQIKKWRRDKKEFLVDKFSSGLPTKQV